MNDLNQKWAKRRLQVEASINIPKWQQEQALCALGIIVVKFTVDQCLKPRIIAVDYEGVEDVVSVSYRDPEPRGFYSMGDYVIDVSLDPIILDLWEKSAEFFTSPYAEVLSITYQYDSEFKMDLV